MDSLRHIWFGLVLALAAASGPSTAADEVITMGLFNIAPYVVATPDGPKGALIDFYDHEIAPRMGVKFHWERPVTIARLEQHLASGHVQMTPLLVQTPARLQAHIQYSGQSPIAFSPIIAVLPEHPLKAVHSPADLEGITIGWVQAGVLPPFMQDRRLRFDLVGNVDWERANLDKLRLGRIGGVYFSDRYTANYYAAKAGVRLRLVELPFPGAVLHAAFAPSVAPALIERYQRAAREAFAGNRFQAYLNKW